jgi:hypothetical protein
MFAAFSLILWLLSIPLSSYGKVQCQSNKKINNLKQKKEEGIFMNLKIEKEKC